MKHFALTFMLAFCAGSSLAQTIVVNTLEDVVDFASPQQVGNLPGPDGRVSMREAVNAANNTPGPQTIEFAIPQSDWWLVPYALLRLENGVFILTDNETTIDFSTQTDFTGDTNPNGTEVGIYGLEVNAWGVPAIFIMADDCVIRGLGTVLQRGAGVSIISGQGNRIVGCVTDRIQVDPYPGTASNNIIGGTDPEDANDLGIVELFCGANDNVVIGNHLRSAAVVGSSYCGENIAYPLRNRIGGPTAAERNVINGFGAYGEEGFPYGSGVRIDNARDTLVEGNYIGVTADGLSRFVQRGTAGVGVTDSLDTTVRGNLISGIHVAGVNHYAGELFGDGIVVTSINSDTDGVVIENNLIGTDASGENAILTHGGIRVAPGTALRRVHNVRIGSNDGAGGNLIAYTEQWGVVVGAMTDGVEVTGNDIHSNGLLGIDLLTTSGGSGVTLNDPGDADVGANGLQNFPVIEAASFDATSTTVSGVLDSLGGRAYRIEVFASSQADPSGYGEGERFLGSTTVTTDADGHAAFSVSSPAAGLTEGWVATATATDVSLSQTSEFGLGVAFVADSACGADFTGDGELNFFDVQEFLAAFADSQPSADITGDGVFDFFDVQEFLALFAAGCP